MAYANDTKPTGASTNDRNATIPKWDDAFVAWDDPIYTWDGAAPYSNGAKPTGSYSNDTKPS